MKEKPVVGIATDGAHSAKEVDTLPGCRPLFRKRTLFQSYR